MSELALPVIATNDSPARPATEDQVAWPPAMRIGFRFFFSYFVLFGFPFPIDRIPGASDVIDRIYYEPWTAFAAWVGERLLGHPLLTMTNGESDRSVDFVQNFLILIVAVLATVVWSMVDRRCKTYPELLAVLRVYVRYMLVFPLFLYAAIKIVKIQFPNPEPDALLQMYGDSQPAKLLWMFMSHSYGYSAFVGTAELLAGLLLCFRRTATLGALIGSATMLNVVFLNVFFNVGVKLWSSNLLLMSGFLVALDARRLANFFVFNRPALPTPHDALSWRLSLGRWLGDRWQERARVALKALVIVLAGTAALRPVLKYRKPPPHALFGIYEVESFVRNGQSEPLVIADPRRWRGAAVNTYGHLTIRFMDDSTIRYRTRTDESKKALSLSTWDEDARKNAVVTYNQDDADHITFEGSFGGDALQVRLRKVDRRFRLLSENFRLFFDGPIESKR